MGCTNSTSAHQTPKLTLPPPDPTNSVQSAGINMAEPANRNSIVVQSTPLIVEPRVQTNGKLPETEHHDESVENLMTAAMNRPSSASGDAKGRTASAQSTVSNISTASKGIAYEFKLHDGATTGNSIVKSHPPKALKRLEMNAEMKLTFEQLNTQLQEAEQRKNKIIVQKQERLKTMASGRAPIRPKTAATAVTAANPDMQIKLEQNLQMAEERRNKLIEETQKKQNDRSARAKRAKEKAQTLQNPEFVTKMDTSGPDGNIEAPLSPMPETNKRVDTFVVEAPEKHEKDDFFG